jgi:hypothetical protein
VNGKFTVHSFLLKLRRNNIGRHPAKSISFDTSLADNPFIFYHCDLKPFCYLPRNRLNISLGSKEEEMAKKIIIKAAGALLAGVLATGAIAQTKTTKNTTSGEKMSGNFKLPALKLEQYTLDNGLRVVLNQDNAAPVVSVAVYYDVGSRNERQGRTGFAHLFEHMMFQGSENVKKAEHFQYVFNAGRHDERHDQHRANELFSGAAGESIAARFSGLNRIGCARSP